MTTATLPYVHLMPHPASEGETCPICHGPTEHVQPNGQGVLIAYWCSYECRAEYEASVRAFIHRDCCDGPPYCRKGRHKPRYIWPEPEPSDEPMAQAANAMQRVANGIEQSMTARREWQAQRQQPRREPAPAGAAPVRTESMRQFRQRKAREGAAA